jgi:DNA-binding transcriptional ArsR family regulator
MVVMGMAGSSLYSREYKSMILRVFGSTPQLRLLDFFMDNLRHDFSRNEIMEAIGMAKRTLYEYLPMLLEEDAVRMSRRIGRTKLYTLNLESPIVRCFMTLEEELTRSEETSSVKEEFRRFGC